MKKAIIIGATSGIGRGLARQLVDNNYKVGITGRREHLLKELKSENPDSYFIKDFDITDTEVIPGKLEELILELGGLDLLIISSGTGNQNEPLDFKIEKSTIDTNVIGFTCIADWTFNFFKKQEFGHLAAISSIGGLRGSRYAPAYNATKAYQINYLEGLRQKASRSKKKVIITDIRPGFVDTAMAKGEGVFWSAGVPKASRQIFKAIKKQKKVVYITKRWRFIAILLALLPEAIYNRL